MKHPTLDGGQVRVVLAARPDGAPALTDFAVEVGPRPAPSPGEILVRNLHLSLDPYLRGRMGSSASHRSAARMVPLGDVMEGTTLSEVVDANGSTWTEGDLVVCPGGWQQIAAVPAASARRPPAGVPVTTALGIAGMPGLTAYAGLLEIGCPRPGETLVVAAATGVVGSQVGQIARIKGARAVGIAGGPDKVAWLREAGFDAVVDHRAPDFEEQLARATPDGIDIYFENVGGRVWDAVQPRLNQKARVPVCGVASAYSATSASSGGDIAGLLSGLVTRSITLQGFVYVDFEHLRSQMEKDVAQWLREGRITYREQVVDGLAQAPEAFLDLLAGRHLGKLLVRVAPSAA